MPNLPQGSYRSALTLHDEHSQWLMTLATEALQRLACTHAKTQAQSQPSPNRGTARDSEAPQPL